MIRICPNPMQWGEIFNRLSEHAQSHQCRPSSPPSPLILSGWAYSNDVEKKQRWEETVAWASKNKCSKLVDEILDSAFYFTEKPTEYRIGPMGGPMYRDWDFAAKDRPLKNQIEGSTDILKSRWPEIVGAELAKITRPIVFTGEKARRLLVLANPTVSPPWGGWSHLSVKESERRSFTSFREAINKAIAPHMVDHIDFVTEWKDEQ